MADGSAVQVSTCTATASSTYVCCYMTTTSYCNQVTSCYKSLYNPSTDLTRYPNCLNTAYGVGDYGCYVCILKNKNEKKIYFIFKLFFI